jgi:hypothetical protein
MTAALSSLTKIRKTLWDELGNQKPQETLGKKRNRNFARPCTSRRRLESKKMQFSLEN